jgi:hypothetical protein
MWVMMVVMMSVFALMVTTAPVITDQQRQKQAAAAESEIYAMHFPDVSSLPCPLVDDVRQFDSVTRVYNRILEASRSETATVRTRLADLHCLAGTDMYFVDSKMRQAATLFENGHFRLAIRHCILELSRSPNFPGCWNMLQEGYFRLGNYKRAYFYSTYIDLVFPSHANLFYSDSKFGNRRSTMLLSDNKLLSQQDAADFHATAYLTHVNKGNKLSADMIDAADAELYLQGLEKEQVDTGDDENDDINSRCNDYFQTQLHDIPNFSIAEESFHWHQTAIVKIYYPNMKGFQIPFGETTLALSEHLSLLGIPNKIVSTLPNTTLVDDTSLFIFLHGTPYSHVLDRLPKYYIFWNFEKHPAIFVDNVVSPKVTADGREYTGPVDKNDIGFGVDPVTGLELIVYPSSFIEVNDVRKHDCVL